MKIDLPPDGFSDSACIMVRVGTGLMKIELPPDGLSDLHVSWLGLGPGL